MGYTKPIDPDDLVKGDRQTAYGHPHENFPRIAQMWSAILGVPISLEQVPLCMIAVKISRECHTHTEDNLTDIIGYVKTLEMVHDHKTIPDLLGKSAVVSMPRNERESLVNYLDSELLRK